MVGEEDELEQSGEGSGKTKAAVAYLIKAGRACQAWKLLPREALYSLLDYSAKVAR